MSYDLTTQTVDESFQTEPPSLTVDNESGIINFIVHGSNCDVKHKRFFINQELFRHITIYFAKPISSY